VAKRQAAGGFAEYTVHYSDGSETSYLVSPHIVRSSAVGEFPHLIFHEQPFPLDYHQTLLSLLDVISEVYNKISRILGPSPFSNSGQHMMGPLGLLAPHPGVSYLFSGQDVTPKPQDDSDGSLWGIANAHTPSHSYGGGLGSPPPSWTPGLADVLLKVDTKFKVGSISIAIVRSEKSIVHRTENNIPLAEGARCGRTERYQGRVGFARSPTSWLWWHGGRTRTV
jgi:hypothetical protein